MAHTHRQPPSTHSALPDLWQEIGTEIIKKTLNDPQEGCKQMAIGSLTAVGAYSTLIAFAVKDTVSLSTNLCWLFMLLPYIGWAAGGYYFGRAYLALFYTVVNDHGWTNKATEAGLTEDSTKEVLINSYKSMKTHIEWGTVFFLASTFFACVMLGLAGYFLGQAPKKDDAPLPRVVIYNGASPGTYYDSNAGGNSRGRASGTQVPRKPVPPPTDQH